MNEYPAFKEISRYDTKDDLYVCAMGFEDRSLGSNLVLHQQNFRAKNTLVLRYSKYIEANERNREQLESVWRQMTDKVGLVNYDSAKRVEFISDFKKAFSSIKNEIETITINITSLITHPLLWLTDFALENSKRVRIVYTEPEGYGNQLQNEYAFSSGVKEIFTMAEFAGALLPGYLSLLVIFLGYDFARARGLYEQIQPSKKIGILADPNTPNLSDLFPRMEEEHKKSFGSSDEMLRFSIYDLKSVIKGLADIRARHIETSNISVALNGTKLHAIAALMFAKKFRDVQLILSRPYEYFPNSYSYGIRRTFELNIDSGWFKKFLEEAI